MTNLIFKSTEELKIPSTIIDQIIGQDSAVNLIKKASAQRRNVLLIGDPGTGKSMLAQGLAELIPEEKLQDVLSYPNPEDDNTPLIKIMSKGKGKEIVDKLKIQMQASSKNQNIFFFILLIIALITPWLVRRQYGDVMAAASLIGSMIFLAAFILFLNIGKRMNLNTKFVIPKLLIDNSKKDKAPFIDATGSKAGALLGDVLHDPLQSFSSNNQILKANGKKARISTEVDKILKKHEKDLIRERGYLAVYLKKDELYILAEKNGEIQPVEVLSVNKYKSDKPYLYKITTESGKELLVTPEHKIAVNNKGKKQYIEASKLKKGKEVFVKYS